MLEPVAVIFDLDGVLIDTVEAHFAGWAAVARELRLPFTREDNDCLRGVPRKAALAWLARDYAPLARQKEEQLLNLKAKVYRERVELAAASIKIKGIDGLLSGLRERGILIGLASASRHAPMLLDTIGLTGMFNAISDGSFTGRLKPHPEQLLHVAARLKVSPASCIVVEDSDVGLEAARRAGMCSIAIGDACGRECATARFASLADVSAKEFLERVGSLTRP